MIVAIFMDPVECKKYLLVLNARKAGFYALPKLLLHRYKPSYRIGVQLML